MGHQTHPVVTNTVAKLRLKSRVSSLEAVLLIKKQCDMSRNKVLTVIQDFSSQAPGPTPSPRSSYQPYFMQYSNLGRKIRDNQKVTGPDINRKGMSLLSQWGQIL